MQIVLLLNVCILEITIEENTVCLSNTQSSADIFMMIIFNIFSF